MSPSIKQVCMMPHCRRVIHDGPPHPVSHGICPECAIEWRRQAKAALSGVVPVAK